MLPADSAPSTDVNVSAGDIIKSSLKSDSLTDSQRSSGDSFAELRSQASASLAGLQGLSCHYASSPSTV